MFFWLTFALMMAVWMIFSGLFDAFHLSLGVLSSLFVAWISQDLLFKERHQKFQTLMREGAQIPGYACWLLWEIVLANIHVFKLAMVPKGMDEVEPEVVRFKTKLRSDFGKWLLANSITLTPGTVTIMVRGDEFVIHAISQGAAEGLNGEMERRIAQIFEPEVLS